MNRKMKSLMIFGILTLGVISDDSEPDFSPLLTSSDSGAATCNEELVYSYRLFPLRKEVEPHRNDICPYVSDDCCSYNSQKMIQVLWGRISKPRLQRVLTLHLSHIEFIINRIKEVLELYKHNELPKAAKYSAECLESTDLMKEFVNKDLSSKLDLIYEQIKVNFDTLYKFKKQFYCEICNKKTQHFVNVFDKQVNYSYDFCVAFSTQFKGTSWFLNYELIRYFETVRNYILCYKEKNYLMVLDKFDFKLIRDELLDIGNCIENQKCEDLCQRYSMTSIPEIFIGNREFLKQMRLFLANNKADNRGYFSRDAIEKRTEKFLQGGDPDTYSEATDEEKLDLNDLAPMRMDFFKPGESRPIDETKWSFYRNTFNAQKAKNIQKKMRDIKQTVKEEYEDVMLTENFLTVTHARHNIIEFSSKLSVDGLNPYTNLNKENIYAVNANLTFYMNDLSNTVSELLNLNETDILNSIVDTAKLMKEDDTSAETMKSYIESKIFANATEKVSYLIENPYVDASVYDVNRVSLIATAFVLLTILNIF